MKAAAIRLTVRCPRCGARSRVRGEISLMADAFIRESPIRLHAACHDLWWDASYTERQEIRKRLIDLDYQPEAELA